MWHVCIRLYVQITEYCACWCYMRYLLHLGARSDHFVKLSGLSAPAVISSAGSLPSSYWLFFRDTVRNFDFVNP